MDYVFNIGGSSARVFYHPGMRLLSFIHGDDFATTGPKSTFHGFVSNLKTKYEPKEAATLGPALRTTKKHE